MSKFRRGGAKGKERRRISVTDHLAATPEGGFWAAYRLTPEQIEQVVMKGDLGMA
jgi:hypothetical protein